MKYHIEKNSVQETLVIPLFARSICSKAYPDLFYDENAERICESLDYDFESKRKLMDSPAGRFGAMEAAQRHFDLICEVKDYLKDHPNASVVNLGCGLDDTFSKVDNGTCRGYNLDLADVIKVRNEILPPSSREENIAFDLRDPGWMKRIEKKDGAVFFAAGVFYYLMKDDVKKLLLAMKEHFPGSVLVFDACNRLGAKMMTKTWIAQAGIKNVDALFYLDDVNEVKDWGKLDVSSKSYMRGYRDIYPDVSVFHKLMIIFCDKLVKMVIVKVVF